MTRPSRKVRGSGERVLPVLGLLVVLAVSGWLGWEAWLAPMATYHLKITGGRSLGPKQSLAKDLARCSRDFGVILSVQESPGSIQSLDQVNDGGEKPGGVDLAIVQGGLDMKRWSEVRQVAALDVEPLQLVVPGDLVASVGRGNLQALSGRRINVGEPLSGTEALARQVLAFDGLRPGKPGSLGVGEYEPMSLSHEQLVEITDRKLLPDATFTVSGLPTPFVQRLVDLWQYRLVPLPFCEAFVLRRPVGGDLLDRVHLHETQIPAFTYGLEPAVPETSLPTIGTRALIVANRKVDAEAIKRLLGVIYLSEFAEVARPPLDSSLLEIAPEFPVHRGTEHFKQRNKPLIWGEAVDSLEKTSSLIGAILGGLFISWQWARRYYRRRRELGFEAYLLKVSAIEREALGLETASRLELAPLLALQGELGRLKAEALERFTLGELDGEGLMSGFLTHANDARDYLARLILHARTRVEKQAKRQGLSPEAAWDLAVGGHDRPDADEGTDPRDHNLALPSRESPA